MPTDGERECWPSLVPANKGHSCYAMCGAGAAVGERAANTVRTDTRQDGQTLDGSQRPERVGNSQQKNSDRICSEKLSRVLGDVHVVNMSSILFGNFYY